ncbi:MAG: AAA family ATPase [Clostridia bacterium]|nr:AAA family ATPase [Clostridia bacterium]
MRISITGTHCCGKTTVIQKVKDKLENAGIDLSGVEFHTFSGKFAPVDYSSAGNLKENLFQEMRLTYWMISKLIERETMVSDNSIIHIFDRCILDQIVYPSVILGDKLSKSVVDYVLEYLNLNPYDKVFILPMNNELLQKYGTKDKSFDYAKSIHDKYVNLCTDYNFCQVLSQNQDEQVEYIFQYILDKISNK